jgi:uncharacterized protein (DUF433 family)
MTDIGQFVVRTPGICGGRPCLAGTRLAVSRVAGWYHQGMSAEDIAREHPHLRPAQIHAALAYYFANQAEVDAEIAEEGEAFDRLRHESAAASAA